MPNLYIANILNKTKLVVVKRISERSLKNNSRWHMMAKHGR